MSKRIIDSFIFYNELDLLNMRLHELNDYVDYFVLVEATETFTGKSKPLHYEENKDRFEQFQDKIIHEIVDDMPETDTPWDREHHQRNRIPAALDDLERYYGLNEEDVILVSDVDEVPNLRSLRLNLLSPRHAKHINVFHQRFFYYNFSCEDKDGWKGTMSFPYEMTGNVDLNRLRRDRYRKKDKRVNIFPRGGWHCSYFGGADKIIDKIEQFSHQELNEDKYKNKETIEKLIENKEDIFFRKNQNWSTNDEDLDQSLPIWKRLAYGNTNDV